MVALCFCRLRYVSVLPSLCLAHTHVALRHDGAQPFNFDAPCKPMTKAIRYLRTLPTKTRKHDSSDQMVLGMNGETRLP